MESSKFGYRFKTHWYFIAHRTFILQLGAPTLSRVTWALLRLLVLHRPKCFAGGYELVRHIL